MALREHTFDCYDLRDYGLLDIHIDNHNVIQKESILENKLVIL